MTPFESPRSFGKGPNTAPNVSTWVEKSFGIVLDWVFANSIASASLAEFIPTSSARRRSHESPGAGKYLSVEVIFLRPLSCPAASNTQNKPIATDNPTLFFIDSRFLGEVLATFRFEVDRD